MAKKTSAPRKIETVASKPAAKATVKTAVRNSPIPKPVAAATFKRADLTSDQIARRAFEIFASGKGGTETDNWFQAERELRAGL